jgi:S1-C subfamily serine protease
LANLGLSLAAQGDRLNVVTVAPNQLAATAGFRLGDRVISVGGTTVVTSRQFVDRLVAAPSADGTVEIRIDRAGQPQTLTLDLPAVRLGTALADANGVVQLASVTAGSPAELARLNPGDQIVTVNGQRVTSLADARARLTAATRFGNEATLMIRRGGALEFARMRAGEVSLSTEQSE